MLYRKLSMLILLLIAFAISITVTGETLQLHQGWTFSEAGKENWISAVVPGTVHQDLLRHQMIPDPFQGMNEAKVQWVEEKDWEYRTTFLLDSSALNYHQHYLVMEGLDTYADVYLNGSLVLRSDNMFVGHTKPVSELLRQGLNHLHIYFHSPIKITLPQWSSNGFDYPADNDHHDKKLSVFTRKAPYSYGWDWGIRLVTSGIWRPIQLKMFNLLTIEDVHVQQLELDDKNARLMTDIALVNVSDESQQFTVNLSVSLSGSEVANVSAIHTVAPGSHTISLPLTIDNPRRWMPNGWGEPILYNHEIAIIHNDQPIALNSQRIGLRTVRLVNEPDALGESFYFEVNGIPIYAKGANYIPSDALIPRMTTERYDQLFRNIKSAHMNMIRVWGGGFYENDYFYDLADENGILVWQDFMFGCTTYPHDPIFLQRVSEEAQYNIKRLRNRASLAMWCGNNEILEGMHHWGWSKRYTPEVYQGMFAGYDKLFRELLPDMVARFDSGRSYIHGSPLSSNWGLPETWNTGDSHNWGVWYGKKPFESFDEDLGRFMSEFGFQSFPEMKTIATFADTADYEIESEVMNAHQKSSIGNSLIRTYMERDYRIPESFEDFVYVGLVLQARGMSYGFEAQRRNRPYCMGTLYWQLNDSWPVVSWSSIDYYGNWKALHYHTRRAFAPLLMSPQLRNDSLFVHVVSDYLTPHPSLTMELQLVNFSGKILQKWKQPVSVPANDAILPFAVPLSILMSEAQRTSTLLRITLADAKGREVASSIFYGAKTKDLALETPEISQRLKKTKEGYELTLTSKKLAKDVFVEIPVQGALFDDNFFDLIPGTRKVVRIELPDKQDLSISDIKLNHIRATYP